MALIDNLISYYKLDETSGTVLDAHGSNDGTNNGATPHVAGKINTAYDFDGTNDYIETSSYSITTDKVSYSFWVKFDSISDIQYLLRHGDYTYSSTKRSSMIGWYPTLKLYFAIFDNDGHIYEKKTDWTPTTGTWYHICVTVDNSDGTPDVKMYINGDLQTSVVNTNENPTELNSNSMPLQVGRMRSSLDRFFNGKIDEVGIWSRALTSTEITELYNSNNGLAYPFSAATQITKDGKARIEIEQTKTKTGQARIEVLDTEKTKSGTARLELSQTKTKTGNAFINTSNQVDKTGQATIFIEDIEKTKSGTARIQINDTENVYDSDARVELIKQETKNSNARIETINQIDKIGNSYIELINQIGKTANARIETINQIEKTGNAFINTSFKAEKTGNAAINILDDFQPTIKSINNILPKIKSVEFFNLKSVKQSDKLGNAIIEFP